MLAFTEFLINTYQSLNSFIGLDMLNPLINSWVSAFFQSDFVIFNLVVSFIIFNLVRRPSKYRFKILGLPKIFQFAIRQVIFFILLTNPVLLSLGMLLSLFLGWIYLHYFSAAAPTGTSGGYILTLLGL